MSTCLEKANVDSVLIADNSYLAHGNTHLAQEYLDAANIIFVVLNKDQEIILINQKGKEMLGYGKDDITGQKWISEFIPLSNRHDVEGIFTQLSHGKISSSCSYFENNVLTKDQSELLVSWSNSILSDKNGEVVGIIGSGYDITALRQSQKKQKESEELYRQLADNIMDCVWLMNLDMEFVYLNSAVKSLIGYSPDELTGSKAASFFPRDEWSKIQIKINDVFTSGGNPDTFVIDTYVIHKDGKLIPIDLWVKVFFDDDGMPLHIQGVSTDITERKAMANSLKEETEQLKSSNEMKKLFADTISHDLVDSASIVSGFLEYLADLEDNEDKSKVIRMARMGATKLLSSINSASIFSKLENEDELQLQKLDILEFLDSSLERLAPNIADKEIYVDIRSNDVFVAELNPIIEEVFFNVLSNSIKYSPNGSTIDVDILDLGDMWKLTFTDSGPGISDEDKDLIFGRLKRVNPKNMHGRGLGLAIAKKIIEFHGGSIGVTDNSQGVGSTFWFTVLKQ